MTMLMIGTGHSRQNLRMFTIHFLNSDCLINICSISAKFIGNVLYSLPEGSVSQNFNLGPIYVFMFKK